MPGRTSLIRRAQNKWRRVAISRWGRRAFRLQSDVPYVSFTFDDYPRSAWAEGGRILREHGVHGTYFVSMGLLGRDSVSGPIATQRELEQTVEDGHELGCHTFDHLDGTQAGPEAFVASIAANRAALCDVFPEAELPVFAFPLEGPTLAVKREVGRRFLACRGGGQSFNAGEIDLNLLQSFFIDWKSRGDIGAIGRLIDDNTAARGWLILDTHDVTPAPSDYGCTPACFGEIVSHACRSGARVLPVAQVCRELGVSPPAGAASPLPGSGK